MKRLSDKLDYKKLGPFRIKRVIGRLNYELALLVTINIYLIFHISLLKLVLLGALLALVTDIEPINLNAEYKVETILNY